LIVARAALVALLFAGCGDPLWKAEGSVADTSGNPIVGASVAIVCPNQEQSLDTVKTTSVGRFEVGGHNAGRAMGCALEVSKPGKHLKTVRMMDVCFRSKKTQNYDLPCGSSEGKITLE
jgi:hypothetical protein